MILPKISIDGSYWGPEHDDEYFTMSLVPHFHSGYVNLNVKPSWAAYGEWVPTEDPRPRMAWVGVDWYRYSITIYLEW